MRDVRDYLILWRSTITLPLANKDTYVCCNVKSLCGRFVEAEADND